MLRINHVIIAFLSILILQSCAKIVPLDGGEKDTIPPALTLAVPPNKTVQFNSKTIFLAFDEYIQLRDIQNQLIVSPPLSERPEIQAKPQGAFIKLKGDLEPNTTYTFNFGDGIVDLNEGNSAKDLSYVISTGPYLDSCFVKGSIKQAFTNVPLESVKVMLYKSFEDSIPLKEKPFYFAKSNKEGKYEIRNLAAGRYKVFALDDANGNYIYDDPTEMIAFTNDIDVVTVVDSLSVDLDFTLCSEENDEQFLEDFEIDSVGVVQMKWFQQPKEYSLENLTNTKISYQSYFNEASDSLFSWPNEKLPVGEYEIKVTADGSIDTMEFDVFNVNPSLRIPVKSIGSKASSFRPLEVEFDYPIKQIDPSKMNFSNADSLPVEGEMIIDPSHFKILGDYSMNPDVDYRWELFPGAIVFVDGGLNDSLNFSFKTHDLEHFGILTFSLTGWKEDYPGLVEFINPDGNVIDSYSLNADEILRYDLLEPGTYQLRVIHDVNSNGKWDPVDYFNGVQPEEVLVFPEEIKVRSNWEQEFIWDF